MLFCQSVCAKRQIWVYEPHFGEVRGDARPWLMARWKAHGRLSIRVNWTFIRYLLQFRSWGEMCTARLFSNGSTYLHSNFTWKGSSPINRSWHQKTRDTGLPDGEDGISLPSLVNTILECDGQTDGYVVANTALAKLALWCTIINCKCITTYLYKVCPWYDLNAVHFARYPLTMSNSALLFTLTVQCKTVLQDNQPWISLHFKLSIGRPIMSPAGNTKVS